MAFSVPMECAIAYLVFPKIFLRVLYVNTRDFYKFLGRLENRKQKADRIGSAERIHSQLGVCVPLDSRLNALKYYLLQHEQNKIEERANMTSAKFPHAIDFSVGKCSGSMGKLRPLAGQGKIKSSAKAAPADDYNNGERITLAWQSAARTGKGFATALKWEGTEWLSRLVNTNWNFEPTDRKIGMLESSYLSSAVFRILPKLI